MQLRNFGSLQKESADVVTRTDLGLKTLKEVHFGERPRKLNGSLNLISKIEG
jgi:hypothetical protein